MYGDHYEHPTVSRNKNKVPRHHDGRSSRCLRLESQVWWAQVSFDFYFFLHYRVLFTLVGHTHLPSWHWHFNVLWVILYIYSKFTNNVYQQIDYVYSHRHFNVLWVIPYIYSKFTNNVYQQIDYVYGHPTLGLNGQWREWVSEKAGELEGGGGRSFQPWKAQQKVQLTFLDYR